MRLVEKGWLHPKTSIWHASSAWAIRSVRSADGYHAEQPVAAGAYILRDAYNERFHPRPLLRQMVQAGYNGKRAGRGWYRYDAKK